MKKFLAIAIFSAGLLPLTSSAESWSGILSPNRAINWSTAGVVGGIPNRSTVCATLNQGATLAQINNAISNCPSGQVVSLTAGKYNLGAGMIILKSGVSLRGAGANQTKLYFTDRGNCGGIPGVICLSGNYINGGYGGTPQNTANWTAGYAQGSTVLTFSSTANLAVGDLVLLDQLDDTADSSGVYVCGTGGVCSYTDAGGDGRPKRFQRQLVTVKAIMGTQVTIDQPLHMPNWRASQSPQARWSGARTDSGMGVENLSIDVTAISTIDGTHSSIAVLGVTNSWVKGIRSIGADRSHMQIYQSSRITVRDSYFYGTSGTGGLTSYGIESFGASCDLLIENNMVQHNTVPFTIDDGGSNVVYGYNFTIDNLRAPDTLMSASFWTHSPGTAMILYEGNSGLGLTSDNWYGTTHFFTLFRNHFFGDPAKTEHTSPILVAAYSRFFNFVGNVLGRPNYYNTYETADATGCVDTGIWCLGFSFAYGGVTDAQTRPRALRWGNYDTVTGTSRFLASEVPSGLSQFSNSVPTSQVLPTSFYLAAKPSWFGNVAWPAVGPDIAGGNIDGYAGHAYKIPARLCWENTASDPDYGTLSVRSFAADSCYSSSSSPSIVLAPPSNLRIVNP
ncbi:MAG: hypothetical protein ACXWRE_03620 [Pseudobdellovibrionaceae bacterium]